MFHSAIASLARYRLFQRAQKPRGAIDIILWWEARRIPYNLIVGSAGVISSILILGTAFLTERIVGEAIGLPDPPFFAIVAVIAYGVMANICFTVGWIAELVGRRVWGDRAEAFGEIAFTMGTIFSALLTLLPAALILSIGAYSILTREWKH